MDKLYIVIPAYNEAENIREVVNEWCKVLTWVGQNQQSVPAARN